MNITPKRKRQPWQYVVLIQEAYVALISLVVLIFAVCKLKIYGDVMYYLAFSYFVAIISLFISGVFVGLRRELKWGQAATAFSAVAFMLLIFVGPYVFKARIH